MTMNKDIFISDISDNQRVTGLFMVQEMRLGETRAGKPYLTVRLMDRSGSIGARVWDQAERLAAQCAPGNIVSIEAQSQTYNGELQLKINSARAVAADGIDLALFMPASPHDIRAMEQEIRAIFDTVADPFLKELLSLFQQDPEIWPLFLQAPAAKHMHHAYIGGLLEHTLGMCRSADMVCSLYPSLDRSLLITGVFLHDLGKIREFSFSRPPFDYTDEGRLVGHMVISTDFLRAKIAAIRDFPETTARLLIHLVLSHHGCHEFGSPTVPMTREAFVLNIIDDLDAKMNYLDRLSRDLAPDERKWSDYQRPLERFIYLRGRDDTGAAPAPSSAAPRPDMSASPASPAPATKAPPAPADRPRQKKPQRRKNAADGRQLSIF